MKHKNKLFTKQKRDTIGHTTHKRRYLLNHTLHSIDTNINSPAEINYTKDLNCLWLPIFSLYFFVRQLQKIQCDICFTTFQLTIERKHENDFERSVIQLSGKQQNRHLFFFLVLVVSKCIVNLAKSVKLNEFLYLDSRLKHLAQIAEKCWLWHKMIAFAQYAHSKYNKGSQSLVSLFSICCAQFTFLL